MPHQQHPRLRQARISFQFSDGSGSPVLPLFFFSVFDVGNSEYFAAEETYTAAVCGGGVAHPPAHSCARFHLPPPCLALDIASTVHRSTFVCLAAGGWLTVSCALILQECPPVSSPRMMRIKSWAPTRINGRPPKAAFPT